MNWLEYLQWREPAWLFLIPLPFIAWLIAYLLKSKIAQSYADPHLLPWVIAKSGQQKNSSPGTFVLRSLAWMLLVIALAGPRIAAENYYLNENSTPAIVFAVDVSKSMSVKDVFPSRFKLARVYINNYIEQHPDQRYGIIIFAARPHILVPPTRDVRSVTTALNAIRLPILPTAGSNINAAIDMSLAVLGKEPSTLRSLVVVSDGAESSTEPDAFLSQLADKLRDKHVRLYTWGTGTKEGDVIYTQSGWVANSQHQAIISRLNSNYLTTLANIGHGSYSEITSDLSRLSDDTMLPASNATQDTSDNQSHLIIWREYHDIFLLAGFILLLISFLDIRKLPVRQTRATSLILAICVLFIIVDAHAVSDRFSAWLSYKNGQYQQAIEHYTQTSGFDGLLGLGSAQYKLGNYQAARQIFTQAILSASNNSQRADAIFNLADCLFKLGDYQTATLLYDDVLRYRPNDKPAQINRSLAKLLNERVKNSIRDGSVRRAGRGPRRADPNKTIDLTDTRVSIASNEDVSTGKHHRAGKTLDVNALIERGIRFSRLVDNRLARNKDTHWQYANLSGKTLDRYINRDESPEYLLWQRIFELEEGFPAPLDEPVTLKGMDPW